MRFRPRPNLALAVILILAIATAPLHAQAPGFGGLGDLWERLAAILENIFESDRDPGGEPPGEPPPSSGDVFFRVTAQRPVLERRVAAPSGSFDEVTVRFAYRHRWDPTTSRARMNVLYLFKDRWRDGAYFYLVAVGPQRPKAVLEQTVGGQRTKVVDFAWREGEIYDIEWNYRRGGEAVVDIRTRGGGQRVRLSQPAGGARVPGGAGWTYTLSEAQRVGSHGIGIGAEWLGEPRIAFR